MIGMLDLSCDGPRSYPGADAQQNFADSWCSQAPMALEAARQVPRALAPAAQFGKLSAPGGSQCAFSLGLLSSYAKGPDPD